MNSKHKNGFSLIELLVVIAIIGILSGIVLVSLKGAREKAKASKAQAELEQIYKSMIMLELDTGQWAGHKTPGQRECDVSNNEICADGCAFNLSDCQSGLLCNDPVNPYPGWKGLYATSLPLDPWGNEYFFDTDYYLGGVGGTCAAVLGSYGPNGEGLNLYDSDDVIYILPTD